MRFIHVADVHLFAEPDQGTDWAEGRSKEIEETFEKVIDACNEKDVDLLLIAGDLFDRSPSVEDLIFVDEKLERLEKTRTIILSGAKDYIPAGSECSSYMFRSRTVMLPPDKTTNAYLRGINTCVTGFSYGRDEYKDRVLEEIEPGREDAINILIGYGGDPRHMPFKREVIAARGFDYVAMGGVHKPTHILKNRMAYAGSPEPLGPKESGRHGYIIGEITDDGTTIKWCPISYRNYVDISITMSKDLLPAEIIENLEGKLRKLGRSNIYRIIVRGFVSDNVKLDLSRVEGRFNISEVLNMTISDYDEKILRVENETNMMGRYIHDVQSNYSLDENVRSRALRYGMEALIMAGED